MEVVNSRNDRNAESKVSFFKVINYYIINYPRCRRGEIGIKNNFEDNVNMPLVSYFLMCEMKKGKNHVNFLEPLNKLFQKR